MSEFAQHGLIHSVSKYAVISYSASAARGGVGYRQELDSPCRRGLQSWYELISIPSYSASL